MHLARFVQFLAATVELLVHDKLLPMMELSERGLGVLRWWTCRDVVLRFTFGIIRERRRIPESCAAVMAPLGASNVLTFMLHCIHIYANINRCL